jgi:hypothetical protein
MKVRPDFDWKAGAVAAVFFLGALAGARWMTDPNLRTACVGLAGLILSTVPSWLFTRNVGGDT